jgi:hypothetical protein
MCQFTVSALDEYIYKRIFLRIIYTSISGDPDVILYLYSHQYHVKKVGIVPARSIKSCSMQAVRQVVFTDVLIVGRLDVHGQSFVPIGLHKIDAASDWLLIKLVCIGMKGLPGGQLQN